MDKRPFIFSLFFLLWLGGGMRLWSVWQQNQTAVDAIEHLSTTTSCAVDEANLQWNGGMPTMAMEPHLQMVVASALNTDLTPPLFEMWSRDPRLYYWFMAQTAVKNEAYGDSLTYLTTADAGSLLDVAGYAPIRTGHTECTLINWTVASEIGYREPPDGYVQHMMNHEQWPQVAEAFRRLLRYDSQRVAWRLSLAKAYVAMGEPLLAEETLAPVILYGTENEIEAANKLLEALP